MIFRLQQKYHMHVLEAKNLSSFLMRMLRLLPEERSTAQELLAHPWLQGNPCAEVAEYVAQAGPPVALGPLGRESRHDLRQDPRQDPRQDGGDDGDADVGVDAVPKKSA